MPMMAMRDTACMPRTTVKAMPSAPKFGPCILADEVGLGLGGLVYFLAYLRVKMEVPMKSVVWVEMNEWSRRAI